MEKLIKKILPILLIPFLIGCDSISSSNSSPLETTSNSDSSSISSPIETIIDEKSTIDTDNWDELMPYLNYALNDYSFDVPQFAVHNYHAEFIVQDEIIAIQIDCLNLLTDVAENTYTNILNKNEFQVVDNEPLYAYKMVSTFDCLYIYYLQNSSTFTIQAYYLTVRTPSWPTEEVSLVTGHKVPSLAADAYYYSVGLNGLNFIALNIDCFFNESSKERINQYVNVLTKDGYEITNQQGYYQAYSSDGEVVVSFNDYYGDGTCIEIRMYSLWPYIDFVSVFGFDLPRYSGTYTSWETKFLSIDNVTYACVYYDGVDETSLSIYGNQLLLKGFIFDESSSSDTSKIYYMAINENEPFVQLAYSSQYKSLCIAVALGE